MNDLVLAFERHATKYDIDGYLGNSYFISLVSPIRISLKLQVLNNYGSSGYSVFTFLEDFSIFFSDSSIYSNDLEDIVSYSESVFEFTMVFL